MKSLGAFIIFLIVGLGACHPCKKIVKQESEEFTQRELDLLSAIEYIKYANPNCEGDCKFKVDPHFRYFDNCLMVWDSIFFSSIGLDYSNEFTYPSTSFVIPDFGRITFMYSVKNEYDYVFSPFVFNRNTYNIHGQVIVDNDNSDPFLPTKFSLILVSLNSKIYFDGDYNYPIDNCYD